MQAWFLVRDLSESSAPTKSIPGHSSLIQAQIRVSDCQSGPTWTAQRPLTTSSYNGTGSGIIDEAWKWFEKSRSVLS